MRSAMSTSLIPQSSQVGEDEWYVAKSGHVVKIGWAPKFDSCGHKIRIFVDNDLGNFDIFYDSPIYKISHHYLIDSMTIYKLGASIHPPDNTLQNYFSMSGRSFSGNGCKTMNGETSPRLVNG